MKKLLNKLKLLNIIRFFYIKLLSPSLANPQLSKYLIDNYDGYWGQQADRFTGNLGFGSLHYQIISIQKPLRVLCIGSQRGFIPAICALACKHNRRGHVDFVDAGFAEPHPKAWSGDGFWKKINPKTHFGKIGIQKYISTFVMSTEEFSTKYPKKRYDYIYVDGDHSYDGVKNDYKLFWPKLNKNGYMAFHDSSALGNFRKRYKFGVSKFLLEISKFNSHIRFPNHPGLEIIQKN